MVSLCRSSTVYPYKHEARQLATTRTLKGNKHVASRNVGKRIVRSTGEMEGDKTRIKSIRGSEYVKVVVKNTIQRSRALDVMTSTSDDRQLITEYLTSVKDQFITERTNNSIEQYAQTLLTRDDPPVANMNAMQ